MKISLRFHLLLLACLTFGCIRQPIVASSSGTRTNDSKVVFVQAGGRWRSMVEYEKQAEEYVTKRHPDLNWSKLEETDAWLNPYGTSNSFCIDFTFGLGKEVFMIYFAEDGTVTNYAEGIGIDRVEISNQVKK